MASTDFNMLRLEAPRNVLQITDRTAPAEEALEISNPATWLRALVKQQKLAEGDLTQLVCLCGNTVDRTDQRIKQIEQAYHDLSEGTRTVGQRTPEASGIPRAAIARSPGRNAAPGSSATAIGRANPNPRDSTSPGSGIGSLHDRTRSMAQSGLTIHVQLSQRPAATPHRTRRRTIQEDPATDDATQARSKNSPSSAVPIPTEAPNVWRRRRTPATAKSAPAASTTAIAASKVTTEFTDTSSGEMNLDYGRTRPDRGQRGSRRNGTGHPA